MHPSSKIRFTQNPSALTAIVLAAATALLAGCSTSEVDKTANWSPNKIYAEARDESSSGAWDKSVPLYEKLEGRAAGTALAQQAQIEKAYAQYKSGEKAQAIATLDRFMKLHPASPAYDYALYLKGLVNFNDDLGMFSWLSRQDLSERDQKAAKQAFESFDELVKRFPDSRYTPDARARMHVQPHLAFEHQWAFDDSIGANHDAWNLRLAKPAAKIAMLFFNLDTTLHVRVCANTDITIYRFDTAADVGAHHADAAIDSTDAAAYQTAAIRENAAVYGF